MINDLRLGLTGRENQKIQKYIKQLKFSYLLGLYGTLATHGRVPSGYGGRLEQ